MKYLISGGGTGGHIYPALAIASNIAENDKEAVILYVGTEKGMESELVKRAGYDFKTIRVKGMPRKINGEFFLSLKEMLLGINDARKIIDEFKPDIVIGTGGYVCGPVVFIAKMKKIKAIIHEQNAFPGITNKILSRYVDRVLVTFEESKKYFKHMDRVVLTGNPIRKELLEVDKKTSYNLLDINKEKPFILSFGGSGGQKSLNDAIYDLIKIRVDQRDFQLIHVTGKRHYSAFMERLKDENISLGKNIRIMPYLYEMPEAMNIASIIVTSAGAITLAELSAIGVASILIPKAYTAENHQEYNARVFEEKGASVLILEKDLDGIILSKTIDDILNDEDKRNAMIINSKRLGQIHAGEKITKIINELIDL